MPYDLVPYLAQTLQIMILVVQPQSTTIHQPSTHIIIKMSTTASSSLHDSKCANCGKGKESSGDLKACAAYIR